MGWPRLARRHRLGAAWHTESDYGNAIRCGTVWLGAVESTGGKDPMQV